MRTFLLAASLFLAGGLPSLASAQCEAPGAQHGSFTVFDLQTGGISVGQRTGPGGYTVHNLQTGGTSLIRPNGVGGYFVQDLQTGALSTVLPAGPRRYNVLNLQNGGLSTLQFQGNTGTRQGPYGR